MLQRAEMEAAVPAAAERVRDLRSEVADPQVVEKAKRRRFSASYKLKIPEEVDRNLGKLFWASMMARALKSSRSNRALSR